MINPCHVWIFGGILRYLLQEGEGRTSSLKNAKVDQVGSFRSSLRNIFPTEDRGSSV